MSEPVKECEEGKCPQFNSENIIYGSPIVGKNYVTFEKICQDCNSYSFEYFKLNYIKTVYIPDKIKK